MNCSRTPAWKIFVFSNNDYDSWFDSTTITNGDDGLYNMVIPDFALVDWREKRKITASY